MGKFYEEIPEHVMEWIPKQKIFWVSTAPLSRHGHVNVSPKGGERFGVPNNKSFWYLDQTGSGSETIAHLLEPGNGRITVLFNAFEGPPRILRLWGKGRVLEYGTPEFTSIVSRENIQTVPGTRSIIVVDIHQVGSSCGYGVPYMNFVEYRNLLEGYFQKRIERYQLPADAPDGDAEEQEKAKINAVMERYWAESNAWSMDGLPGLRRGLEAGKRFAIKPVQKMVGKMAIKNPGGAGSASATAELHVAYVVIALLMAVIAVLGATHPAFEYFPAQRRMQDLLSHVTSLPSTSHGVARSL